MCLREFYLLQENIVLQANVSQNWYNLFWLLFYDTSKVVRPLSLERNRYCFFFHSLRNKNLIILIPMLSPSSKLEITQAFIHLWETTNTMRDRLLAVDVEKYETEKSLFILLQVHKKCAAEWFDSAIKRSTQMNSEYTHLNCFQLIRIVDFRSLDK